ncbi:metalloregulator ArsR/SmtB family transcription factor [Clostridium sp. UBA4395]|uniref:ArsR/SmtB family transcription factor n=1 Tax=Clostridium sp. UBA4395 TaxID=1946360 RepID=UPI003216F2B6
MIDIFKALSEESRLRILMLLMHDEMCVCEIEECLKMTQSNVSRHLTTLRKCGILDGYKRAQWMYYKISEDFKKEHKYLWLYLEEKLKESPDYENESEKCHSCKSKNMCNIKDT